MRHDITTLIMSCNIAHNISVLPNFTKHKNPKMGFFAVQI